MRWTDDLGLLTFFHLLQRFGPAGHDLVQRKLCRFPALDGAVEDCAVGQLAFVMDLHDVHRAGARSISWCNRPDHNSRVRLLGTGLFRSAFEEFHAFLLGLIRSGGSPLLSEFVHFRTIRLDFDLRLGVGDGVGQAGLYNRQFIRVQGKRFDVASKQHPQRVEGFLVVSIQLRCCGSGGTRRLRACDHRAEAEGERHSLENIFNHKQPEYLVTALR